MGAPHESFFPVAIRLEKRHVDTENQSHCFLIVKAASSKARKLFFPPSFLPYLPSLISTSEAIDLGMAPFLGPTAATLLKSKQ